MKYSIKRRNLRIVLWIIFGLFVCFVGYFGWSLYLKEKQKREFNDLISGGRNLEVSNIILDWIDKERDERGLYYSLVECEIGQEECVKAVSNHQAAAAAKARYSIYKKYNDDSNLAILKRDLQSYANESSIITIQTGVWNCTLLKEIILDETLDTDIRENAKTICFKGRFSPTRIAVLNNLSESIDNTIKLSEKGNTVISAISKVQNISSTDEEFVQYSIMSSEFVALDQILKSNDNKIIAKKSFDYATKIYLDETEKDQPKFFKDSSVCIYANAALDLYYYTRQPEYLSIASRFYTPEDVLSYGDFSDKIFCKLYYDRLYQEYGYDKFFYSSRDISRDILLNNFDRIGSSSGFRFNDGLYSNHGDKLFYNVMENNLFVSMYAREN